MLWHRWMIILVAVASVQFVVRVSQIYIMARLSSEPKIGRLAQKYQIDPGFFKQFLDKQSFFILLIVILAGAGLVSKDKKFNALQIYFSKSVSKWDYIGGKFAIIGFYISLITLLPALLLFITKILLSEKLDFLSQYFWIPFSILGYFLLIILVYGTLILALSSLGKGTRFAAISFFTIFGITDLVKKILSSIPEAGAVSLWSDLQQAGDLFFKRSPSFAFPTWLAFVVLGGVISISLLVLRMRIRGTEVVR